MEIRQFLGFTEYYRYFVPNYLGIARPLLDLTKKSTPWHWGKSQHKAFKELKTRMCCSPVLIQPDFTKWFYLNTDASLYGMGTITWEHGKTLLHSNQPCQPSILKVPKKSKPEDSLLACWSTRVQLQNPTHTRKRQHSCWCPVMTTWHRLGKRWQPRCSSFSAQTLHSLSKVRRNHKQRSKTQPHDNGTWPPFSQTPWMGRNHTMGPETLHMERHETMDHWICQRMCNLSTKQEPHS